MFGGESKSHCGKQYPSGKNNQFGRLGAEVTYIFSLCLKEEKSPMSMDPSAKFPFGSWFRAGWYDLQAHVLLPLAHLQVQTSQGSGTTALASPVELGVGSELVFQWENSLAEK